MNFDKLNEMIPYAKGGKKHALTMHPYNAITLAMPGRHALDTDPIGGDFVVMVDDEGLDWVRHQFKHSDIFNDLQQKHDESSKYVGSLMDAYLEVVHFGHDPEKFLAEKPQHYAGLHPHTFLFAVQCLAVAEHRRYARFEGKFGGKYLPLRFACGIVEGLWTAEESGAVQKYGRPAVEKLERQRGVPALTKQLMEK